MLARSARQCSHDGRGCHLHGFEEVLALLVAPRRLSLRVGESRGRLPGDAVEAHVEDLLDSDGYVALHIAYRSNTRRRAVPGERAFLFPAGDHQAVSILALPVREDVVLQLPHRLLRHFEKRLDELRADGFDVVEESYVVYLLALEGQTDEHDAAHRRPFDAYGRCGGLEGLRPYQKFVVVDLDRHVPQSFFEPLCRAHAGRLAFGSLVSPGVVARPFDVRLLRGRQQLLRAACRFGLSTQLRSSLSLSWRSPSITRRDGPVDSGFFLYSFSPPKGGPGCSVSVRRWRRHLAVGRRSRSRPGRRMAPSAAWACA